MSKKIYEYVFEALLIIFSVILALVLNEYRNNLQVEKDLDIILSNVKTEIQSNNSTIEDLVVYHKKSIAEIDQMLASDSAIDASTSDYGFDLFKVMPQGVFPTSLNNSAWEVAKSSETISQIDIDQAQFLSQVYAQQELTLIPVSKIYDFATDRESFDSENAKENLVILSIHLKELYGRENGLLRLYEDALEILK